MFTVPPDVAAERIHVRAAAQTHRGRKLWDHFCYGLANGTKVGSSRVIRANGTKPVYPQLPLQVRLHPSGGAGGAGAA